MKSVELNGTARESLGTTNAKSLRKEGMVPCVIYGGKENIHFYADSREFTKIVYTPEVFAININVAGKTYKSIMQEIQFHPVTDALQHIDFVELQDDKVVTIALPITLVGQSRGVKNGGRLRLNKRKVKVKGLPSALVDEIKVDITELRIGQSFRIKDLSVPGLEFIAAPNDVVVQIKAARKMVADTDDDEESEDGEATEEGAEAPAEAAAAE